MLSCKQASQLISQSLDRRLTMLERVGLRLHLLFCDMCTAFKRQLGVIRLAVKRYKMQVENNPAIKLSEEARVRISSKIESN